MKVEDLTPEQLEAAKKEAAKIEAVLSKFMQTDKDAIQVIFAINKYATNNPVKYKMLKLQLFKEIKSK